LNPKENVMRKYLMLLATTMVLTAPFPANAAMAVGTSSGLGLSGGFEGGNVGAGFHSSAFVSAPPPVINNPAPVFNPSESYTLPESPETPISPASPGSVFGNG
jgi:hypothetical protein